MALIIFGIILIVGGGISLVCGSSLNNSYEARWNSFWESGRSNPGEVFVTLGIIALVLGFILLISGIVLYIVKSNKKPPLTPSQSRAEYLNYLKNQGLITDKDISEHHPISNKPWQCPRCGRLNDNYVGTYGCGMSKAEAQGAIQANGQPEPQPELQPQPQPEPQSEPQPEQSEAVSNPDKKYCTLCGTQLNINANFCSKCGTKQ
ncbi:MAG: zinc-ribbon domain-containing protein [Acutalibacteraceae bacterium]